MKPYVDPTFRDVTGWPEIVGATLGRALTEMENGRSDALATPSLTLITIFEYTPTLAAVGTPASWPVLALKLAQAGLPTIANVRG